jgi:glycosyltransferase involved in cell wall biosynthesis
LNASTQPLVTVATAVYNFLAECAESVLRQTYSTWRYHIIDNCSADRTPEIAREIASRDPRVQYERHDDFVDVNERISRGFAAVDPEASYVKIVDANDWIYPECLERMVALGERACHRVGPPTASITPVRWLIRLAVHRVQHGWPGDHRA